MSSYHLERLFAPRSVALVGASPKSGSVGRAILENLYSAGFQGLIWAVNPKYADIDGVQTHASLAALPEAPDLVILVTPPATIPALIDEAAACGAAAAIVISAGLGHGPGSIADDVRQRAHRLGLRLIGPNCLGVISPAARLNASFSAHMPAAGYLALISQSGAIVAGLVEWAVSQGIGFSGITSMGDQLDVDFGDLLDYHAMDRSTRAILLYMESVKDPRKFISAARAAARAKPVVVVKAGRHAEGAAAARTHTGALAGADDVFDAVFRRTGLLRVHSLDELIAAAQTLARVPSMPGDRLAIMTNGGGLGVLGIDRLLDLGGTPAELSKETLAALDACLPPNWSRANPIDIIGDADPDRYEKALEVLLAASEIDAVLLLNISTRLARSIDSAHRVAEVVTRHRRKHYPGKPVLPAWVGDDPAAVDAFVQAGMPHYHTEADAISGFMHLTGHAAAQKRLMQTPPAMPADFQPDHNGALAALQSAAAEARSWLNPLEAAALLTAYGIPVLPVSVAENADQAVAFAKPWLIEGGAVALKIHSSDIQHKSDVGGVMLNLGTAEDVRQAAVAILERAASQRPSARIQGVLVQPMFQRSTPAVRQDGGQVQPSAPRELIAGIANDACFGPVILFGQGGTAVEVIRDKALALPPLDLQLAEDLIAQTRISRLLDAYRNVPAADRGAVARTLVRLAQMAVELPVVCELDINPLLADEQGVVAIDARVQLDLGEAPQVVHDHPRLAIRPYPAHWVKQLQLRDGQKILARPVRPEDEHLYDDFFTAVTAEDMRLRFFSSARQFSHSFIARLTQLDYARSMAFVALRQMQGDLAGVARMHADADYRRAEVAVLVRSDLKGQGLGLALMRMMLDYLREEGIEDVYGQVLTDNRLMLDMCRDLGFELRRDPDQRGIMDVTLRLQSAAP